MTDEASNTKPPDARQSNGDAQAQTRRAAVFLSTAAVSRPIDPLYDATYKGLLDFITYDELTNARLDDLAGYADGHSGHILNPKSRSGRQGWECLSLAYQAAVSNRAKKDPRYLDGFMFIIVPINSDFMGLDAERRALPPEIKRSKAKAVIARRDLKRQIFAELGRHGARQYLKKVSEARRIEIARHAAAVRWGRRGS